MALPRAYVPSIAILRALSRPTAPACAFARRIPSQCLRGKASKASKARPAESSQNGTESQNQGPRKGKGLYGSGLEAIEWYEQDAERREPQRLISRIDSPEQVRRLKKMNQMMDERDSNPDYDASELNAMQLDDLINDPNFADVRDELEQLKGELVTKAQIAEAEKEEVEAVDELDAEMRKGFQETIQEMIDDPELAEAKDELMEVLRKMPEWEDLDNPEFYAALEHISLKLDGNKAWERRLAGISEPEDEAESEQSTVNEDGTTISGASLDKLLGVVSDLSSALPGDSALKSDIEALKSPPSDEELDAEIERDIDNMQVEAELENAFANIEKRVVSLKEASGAPPTVISEGEEKPDPQAEALVDKLIDDPNLMDKLRLITDILKQQSESRKPDIVTLSASTSAPDPEELSTAELTTLQQQLKIAENDPEHIAAMRRLKVNLLPPFNVAPVVRSLNQALKLAYCGASDDVRRILWRAYVKARTVPTLIANMPDDAWDMLWYSQSVVWKGNQNRKNHLAVLLRDLRSIGREGPPTMPQGGVEKGVKDEVIRLQKIRKVLMEGIEE